MVNFTDKTSWQRIETSSQLDKGLSRDSGDGFISKKTNGGKETKGSNRNNYAKDVLDALLKDFPLSITVIVLAGYVIIESFGDEGVEIKEYASVIVVLLFFVLLYKFIVKIELIGKIKLLLNSRRITIILLIIIFILLIDAIINHWPFIIYIVNH